MKLLLKDLKPGDIFQYEDGRKEFLSGTFMRIHENNSYIRPITQEHRVFIVNMNTGMIHRHADHRKVNLISKSEDNMKSQKEMDHFIGWKFGVPVRIYEHNPGGYNYPEYEEARLIYEDGEKFIIVFDDSVLEVRSRYNFHYELIPHKICGTLNPRYPVCQNSKRTAYCNSSLGNPQMVRIDSCETSDVKHYPVATLNIDGKTIELSTETTAELKKKLGV